MAPRAAAREHPAAPGALPRVRLARTRVAPLTQSTLIRVLAIGGFEPLGRVGVLADAWAIRALGAQPLLVVTAITAQGARFATQAVAPDLVRAQLDAALAERPAAVKVGMIPDARVLAPIVACLRRLRVPIVVDPVVRTSRGERLSSLRPIDYRRLAFPHAVLTPNRDERAWLGADAGFATMVVKGSDTATDEVVAAGEHTFLRGTRLPRNTSHHRGTGCRFGSGLAVGLARGEDVVVAARGARRLVRKFLSSPILR